MLGSFSSSAWTAEQNRWRTRYRNSFPEKIGRVISLVEKKKRTPEQLLPHFDSMLALFDRSIAHPESETRLKLLQFVQTLHPLPLWWGKWSEWLRILEQAATVARAEKKTDVWIWLLLVQADMLLSKGRGKKSRQLSKTALKNAEKHHLAEMSLRAELSLFEANKYLGETDDLLKALTALEKSLDEKRPHLDEKTSAELTIEILLKKADTLRRQGQLEHALAYIQQAYALAKAHYAENDFFMTKLYTHRSTIDWAKGEYDLSIEYRKKALKVFRLWGDKTSQIEYEGDIGLILWSAERHKEAEKTLLSSIKKAERLYLLNWQTVQTGDLALVHLSCGRLKKAHKLLERHRDLSRWTNNYAEEKRALGNLSIVQTHLGEFQNALENIRTNLQHTEKYHLDVSTNRLLLRLAWALDGLGRKNEAVKYAYRSLESNRKINDSLSHIMALRCLSELNIPEKDKLRYAKEALKLAKEHHRRLNQAGALFTLAHCTHEKKYHNRAVKLLEEIGAEAWLKTQPVFESLRLPLLA